MTSANSKPKGESTFLDVLRELYWNAAEKEVRSMILFYNSIESLAFEGYDENIDITCDNFKKMFDLWRAGKQGTYLRSFDTSGLFQETISRSRKHCRVDRSKLLARYLLQSSSFLDIDVLYEPPFRFFPSFSRGDPNVEKVYAISNSEKTEPEPILRGIYCSSCQLLIRSLCFYECNEGCKDLDTSKHPVSRLGRMVALITVDDVGGTLEPPSRRLCPTCSILQPIDKSCKQSHLQKLHYENPTDKCVSQFQRLISNAEDKVHLDKIPDKKLKVLLKAVKTIQKSGYLLDTPFAGLQQFYKQYNITGNMTKEIVKTVQTGVTPAGTFHLAMMFGPLIFESGVEKIKSGILVSPRPCTRLFSDISTVSTLLYDGEDREESAIYANSLIFYRDKVDLKAKIKGEKDVNRKFERKRLQIQNRPTVAYVKRVYGAAFSGYYDHGSVKETTIVDALVEEAHRCLFKPSKTVVARRRQLHASSKRIVDLLRLSIGAEVDKYLSRIEKILYHPDTKISFNQWTNNCQSLVSALLAGKDFEYSFPRFSQDYSLGSNNDGIPNADWPQYLISFGELIEKQGSSRQRNSAVEGFLNYEDREYDLVDFLEYSLYKNKPGQADEYFGLARKLYLLEAEAPQQSSSTRITDLLWEMPRDTLSILQNHFHRPSWKYRTSSGQLLDHQAWLKNRLLALQQLDMFASLAGSLGVALLSTISKNPKLLSKIIIPKSHVYGHLHVNDQVRIVRTSPSTVMYAIFHRKDGKMSAFFNKSDTELGSLFQIFEKAMNKVLGKVQSPNPAMWKAISKLLAMEMKILLSPSIVSFLLTPNMKTEMALLVGRFVTKAAMQLTGMGNKSGGWAYYDLGDLVLVHQIFRKTKTFRKGGKFNKKLKVEVTHRKSDHEVAQDGLTQ